MDTSTAKRVARELAESTAEISLTTVFVDSEKYVIVITPASSLKDGHVRFGTKGIKKWLKPHARLMHCPECGKPV